MEKRGARVAFDVFYRRNPDQAGFAIFAGLEQILDYLANLHFDKEDVPPRSSMGNRITSAFFKLCTGVACSDTQTGLRGIPSSLIPLALSTKGDRYDYEMNFLMAAVKKVPLVMIPIETVYMNGNEQSHFHPVRDSFLIYKEPLKKVGLGLAAAGLLAVAADIVIRMSKD